MKTLILIDGSSYLYRAFHAISDFFNAQGVPTGAVYGMSKMLQRILKQYHPTYAAVVFDAKGPTFRHTLYPQYKAHRPHMPDDLRLQIPFVHEMVHALGFPVLIERGVEADDVIGTLAKKADKAGMETLIFTGDKDFAQLVTPTITLIDTMHNTHLDVQGIEKKFGIPPHLFIDYLTLVGDTVDNVPGVNKVGPKTAVKWLKQYGSLKEVIHNASSIKGKVGENLRDALAHLPLTQKLITLKCDVPLSHNPLELTLTPTTNIDIHTITPTHHKKQAILNQEDFQSWLKRLEEVKLFAFSIETTSLDYLEAEIVGISLAVAEGESAYIPLRHDYLGAQQQLSLDAVLAALKPFLESKAKVGHNLKYNAHVLANYGIQLGNLAYDTMLESYVLESTATQHDVESMALKYLDLTLIKYENVVGKGKKQLSFNQIELETATSYAAENVSAMLQLHHALYSKLPPKLNSIFTTLEMPLIPVLMRMERNGVKVDAKLLYQQSLDLTKSLESIQKEAYILAGIEFNLNSPKQLQMILFETLQLPVLKKTPKKEPSTAVDVLEELALTYPLPKLVLEYRSLIKLRSTYTDALQHQINPKTGRIHTSYQQAVTATGRLSSINPNLQNIPIRRPEGRRIRQAFVAKKGYRLITADYSQIELRIMAYLSQDAKLLGAFAAGEDIHKATASEVFDVALEDVTTEQRRNAKAVNFGLIYGMQAFGLAKQLGVKRAEAQKYIDLYFARYPGVKNYMEETCLLAQQQAYVETLFGRRLYLHDIHSRNPQRRKHAERTAINMPLQGTSADILKKSLLAIDHQIQDLDAKLILQVHDELVLETHESIIDKVSQILSDTMCAVALPIDVPVNIGIGDNWEMAH